VASPHGSPACASLVAAALTRLSYRYRRIARLFSFGLQALGSAAQRTEWEVGPYGALPCWAARRAGAAGGGERVPQRCPPGEADSERTAATGSPAPPFWKQSLYQETDAATGRWLSHAAALLAACSSQLGGSGGGVTHVAVTSGQLVPSLAKLLLFRLGGHIAADNVWSSRHCGKAACFERVRQRFGAGCRYVAVGARRELAPCRRYRTLRSTDAWPPPALSALPAASASCWGCNVRCKEAGTAGTPAVVLLR
jgi:hypothetical protein